MCLCYEELCLVQEYKVKNGKKKWNNNEAVEMYDIIVSCFTSVASSEELRMLHGLDVKVEEGKVDTDRSSSEITLEQK